MLLLLLFMLLELVLGDSVTFSFDVVVICLRSSGISLDGIAVIDLIVVIEGLSKLLILMMSAEIVAVVAVVAVVAAVAVVAVVADVAVVAVVEEDSTHVTFFIVVDES